MGDQGTLGEEGQRDGGDEESSAQVGVEDYGQERSVPAGVLVTRGLEGNGLVGGC